MEALEGRRLKYEHESLYFLTRRLEDIAHQRVLKRVVPAGGGILVTDTEELA